MTNKKSSLQKVDSALMQESHDKARLPSGLVNRASRHLGTLLAIASSIWCMRLIAEYWSVLETVRSDKLVFSTVIAIILSYPTFYALAALNWSHSLKSISSIHASWAKLVIASLDSQINKYLPGNIGHHISKFAAGKRIGFESQLLAKSFITEHIFLVISGVSVGFFLIASDPSLIEPSSAIAITNELKFQIALTIGVLLVIALAVKERTPIPSKNKLMHWTACYCICFACFLLHGLTARILLVSFGFEQDATYLQVTCVFAIAWVVGFITPGSPGGIGVREATFIYLLQNQGVTLEVATLLAALLRIVSVLGDLWSYMFGILLKHTMLKPKISMDTKPL